MPNYRTNRLKIIDYLFDLLPPNEREEVEDTIDNDPTSKWCYDRIRRNISIESYLDNEMPLHEKIEFIRELETDSRLAEEVNFRKKVNAVGKMIAFREELEDIHDEYAQHRTGVYIFDCISPQVKRILAAASVILILALGSLTVMNRTTSGQPVENRMYTKYYQPFESKYLFKYIHSANALYEARREYEQGNYDEALYMYNNLPNSFDVDVEKQFYQGLILMEVGQLNEAIKKFEYLKDYPGTKFMRPYVKWYLGMCYLNTCQREKAKNIFNEIVQFGSFNYKKAERILKKLS